MSEELHKAPLNGDDKLVTLSNLAQYNHKIIAALGLVQDTGAYKYNGTRDDFPEEVFTVGKALDELYDMAKEGSLQFHSGWSKDAKTTIDFKSDDNEETNLYWIHANVGDEIVNIKIDANRFIKNSVLENVTLVTKIVGEDGSVTYKVNGVEAEKPTGFDNDGELSAGTYFFYTWKVDGGETGTTETAYTSISLKDIYGDLKGDGYVRFDSETATIGVNVADVEKSDDGWRVKKEEGDDTDTHLATAEGVATIAQTLQNEIDENKVDVADVTYEDTKTMLTISSSKKGTVIGLNLNVSDSDDINALFCSCVEIDDTTASADDIKAMDAAQAMKATLSLSNGETVEDVLAESGKTYKNINIIG